MHFALLDNSLEQHARLYTELVDTQYLTVHELPQLDTLIAQGHKKGWHLVVLADYHLGENLYGIEQKTGYLSCYWFKHKQILEHEAITAFLESQQTMAVGGVMQAQPAQTYDTYAHRLTQIKEAILNGETYQINYTFPLNVSAYGDVAALYQQLRQAQPVKYGCLTYLPDVTHQDFYLLSCSPELFFKTQGDAITAQPMKGTARIVGDPQGEQAQSSKIFLRNDPKNRAENLMIVDLLRNDLGRVAQTGSVVVDPLFEVSQAGQVWQMTSTVKAQCRPHTGFAQLFEALYPCGSITGAPKKRSMQLIAQLEDYPRDVYTGSLGYIDASSTGTQSCFNILIRTICFKSKLNGFWQGTMGVGGGIVHDSQIQDEWEETQHKAFFLTHLADPPHLIETMRYTQGHVPLWGLHVDRVQRSCRDLFDLTVHDQAVMLETMQQVIARLDDSQEWRLRFEIKPDGSFDWRSTPLDANPSEPVYVGIADQLVCQTPYSPYKTTLRQHYDKALKQAMAQGFFDVLFFNPQGHLVEGARSNVFIQYQDQWYTPSVQEGALAGVMAQAVCKDPSRYLNAKVVHVAPIDRTMLLHAQDIVVTNAVRGCLHAKLVYNKQL